MRLGKYITGVLLSFAGSLDAFAEVIDVAFSNEKPPYIMDKGRSGIIVDLVREALAYKGHSIKPHQFAQDVMDEIIARRRVDMAAFSYAPKSGIHLSLPYITFRNTVISKTRDKLTLEHPEDLKGYRIAAWPGAWRRSGDDYETLFRPEERKRHSPHYVEQENQLQQNQMFWRNHVDILVIDEYIFSWYRQQLAESETTSPDISLHPDVLKRDNPTRAAFLDPKLRDDFDEGIAHLKASGEYQRIIERYIAITPPPPQDAPLEAIPQIQ